MYGFPPEEDVFRKSQPNVFIPTMLEITIMCAEYCGLESFIHGIQGTRGFCRGLPEVLSIPKKAAEPEGLTIIKQMVAQDAIRLRLKAVSTSFKGLTGKKVRFCLMQGTTVRTMMITLNSIFELTGML